jgi:branched-chain amino acid transport system ATP-binding protein
VENVLIPVLFGNQDKAGRAMNRAQTRCLELLDLVGLSAKATRMPQDLTQIEMRKLELARAMASEPRLLIADEVMAGLSNQEVDDILALLARLNAGGVTIIMIEHIMRAVMSFSQRLVVLVAGRKIADDEPARVIRQPDVVTAYLGS